MRLIEIQIRSLTLNLRQNFKSNHENLRQRRLHILRLTTATGQISYGELEAFDTPTYMAETQATAIWQLKHVILPRILNRDFTSPRDFNSYLADIVDNQLAKAAVEMPVWELFAQLAQLPLADYLAQSIGTKAQSKATFGVSLGINDQVQLIESINHHIASGVQRFKIKLGSVADIAVLRTIRQIFPSIALLVDGNGAFQKSDLPYLKQLDTLQLDMLEQPFTNQSFLDHQWLQRQLQTPICLDERIHDMEDLRVMMILKSGQVLNLKPARVGGFQVALAMLKFCQQHGLPCWVGGMVESDLGRRYVQEFARLSGLEYPGDIGPVQQFYQQGLLASTPEAERSELTFHNQVGLGLQPSELLTQLFD
ncbi:o-succinylbenzoate synthase [Agrilactobacillus fermenti]|uniref:o-succinylbenzoate synthase n=1 Tax=Agrilactobacillus fermenti TaxID=2586909 RepID=UPI001E35A97D|nr:o-succinylbenzoate synthase [Agrilactobacillus fermenti]MCD2257356.1 o-succinylbenzoate synthase [Agrilactobacillus fermenti]